MTNSELRDIVFNKIKEFGFKIYNVENVDGYFICDMGKDSVTHFRLKGKGMWKHWKFGLWLNENYMLEEELCKVKEMHENGEYGKEPKVIQLFAQHDTWIDKFKPSRSALLFKLDAEDINNFINKKDKNIYGESYTFNNLKTMLKMMCRHPFICYNEYCGEYVGYTDKSFILEYIKYETKDRLNKLNKIFKLGIFLPYTKIKIALCKHSKIIHSIELYDFEKENEGWSTDYLYQPRITFNENVTEKQMCKWLDFWWKKEKYGKFGYYDYIIELSWFSQVGRDGSFIFDWN